MATIKTIKRFFLKLYPTAYDLETIFMIKADHPYANNSDILRIALEAYRKNRNK